MKRALTITATALTILAAAVAPAAADGTITWAAANSTATGDQDNSAVSAVRNGYVAVVWEDDRDTAAPENPLHSDVWIRLYRDGASLYEKKLSAGGEGNWSHLHPDVALHDDGTAVVVWADDKDGNGYYQIAVRTLNTAGTVTGSATANANSDGQQINPAVAADPDGAGFAVAFEDKQGTAAPTVRVSGFNSITAKAYEVQVNAAGGTHQRPDVAMGAAQNAIVVWDEDTDANGFFTVARKAFTPSGGVKLAQSAVNVIGDGQQRHASIAANFNGDHVVGWETDHTGTVQIGVRSFTATGAASSTVDTYLPGADPQVGIDDQRAAVVTWTEAQDIFVQGLNPDGSVTGRQPRIRANTNATGRQDEPALGVDAWGQIVMTYTDDADGNTFDQVYLGTGLNNSTWS
ncbi:hypothetical protein [Kibdelosporangium phytohabitans]|uniref:Uncharacterized protein n=1 Tax=Kibdelosporangium phytohabitans TaxID=860235 RepID=A0A0N9I0G9_9PSEU|nr:hypothetical protein [Kibdelosporangium phytohabitans]ALG09492.1 hypothetical protein AOZ06_23595 [Kibdelosporangium phytohabitans]MBE1469208.1 hypothetical protein [Kibdelosporangium phytohabitans]